MKILLILLFLNLSLTKISEAAPGCESLFQSAPSVVYKKYDPNNIDEQIGQLFENGELAKIRKANPRKTNLPYFEDYVLDALDRLIKVKIERNNPTTTSLVDEIGIDAFKRIANKSLTYEWVISFSYRAIAIFERQSMPPFKANLDWILNSFPYDIMVPTFAEMDFKHFIQIEGHEFTFLGMKDKEVYVDGNAKPFTPEQFFNHDFVHYYLTKKNEDVLNPHNNFHESWLELHQKIKTKLENLPEERRRYAEYIYFFILHEDFGFRTNLVQRYFFRSGTMSQFVSQMLDFETIKNHYNGLANPINIERSEIYKRTVRAHGFVDAFPEKTNPQDILLVGIGDFIQIIKEIESKPAD